MKCEGNSGLNYTISSRTCTHCSIWQESQLVSNHNDKENKLSQRKAANYSRILQLIFLDIIRFWTIKAFGLYPY